MCQFVKHEKYVEEKLHLRWFSVEPKFEPPENHEFFLIETKILFLINSITDWCEANCTGRYSWDRPNNCVNFEKPSDAFRFKLTFG